MAHPGVIQYGIGMNELLLSDTGKAKAAGLVRELLVTAGSTSPATRAYVGGLEREALVAPPQTTRLRPYLLINA
jgi:hypothetical protein